MSATQHIRDNFCVLHPTLVTRVQLPSGERLATYIGFNDFEGAIAFLYKHRYQFTGTLRKRVCPCLMGEWEIELKRVKTEDIPRLWAEAKLEEVKIGA